MAQGIQERCVMNLEQAQIRGLGGGSAMKSTRDSMIALIWLTLCIISVGSDLLWANDRPRLANTSDRVANGSVRAPSNLIRVPQVRQSTDYTCGVSALHSVLAYYGEDIRDDRLAKALRTTRANGTNYHNLLRFAANHGYRVQMYTDMGLDQLRRLIDRGKPTILVIQAWRDKPVDWVHDWDDGHYVVAIGYDQANLYFMDPSTLGNYTFIPVEEFLDRWHDRDQRGRELIHFGIVIDGKKRAYDADEIKSLD
jgi:predicted double-glycine peptidase